MQSAYVINSISYLRLEGLSVQLLLGHFFVDLEWHMFSFVFT